jgi:hypothetical protein
MRVGAAALAVAAAMGLAFATVRQGAEPERHVTNRPVQMSRDGYESSSACRACHPSEYASWHVSFHRTMTQVATPETVAASFDHVSVTDVVGEPMRLEVRGQQLWAEFDDPDGVGVGVGVGAGAGVGVGVGAGARVGVGVGVGPRIQRRVVMTTGSHNQQIYWYVTGSSRLLGQLPAIWLTADRRWIPRRAAVMRPPGPPHAETGAWNGICVACHTTDGRPRLDAPFGSRPIADQIADTTSAEFAVACEACHGPGGDHVRANAAPRRRYWLHLTGRADPTIVRPDRLDPRRSSQVCGQCHSFWEFADAASERRANSAGLPYRPGDDLTATRLVVQPTVNLESAAMKALLADDPGFVRDTFWPDGMVRATGREYNGLIDSPCFRRATDPKRTLSCFSCHTMHEAHEDRRTLDEWRDDQLAVGADGNGACLQCHDRGPERAAPQHVANVDVAQHVANVDVAQHVANVDVAQHVASVDVAQHVASVDVAQHVASVDVAQHVASVDVAQHVASVDVARAFQARDLSAHTHHRADSSGSVCYNCHMPYTTYGLLKTIRSHQISSPSVKETLEAGRMNACNLCHLDRTLAWTAAAINKWYGTPAPPLAGDDESVAASLVTLLKGDAGQRAIVAQSLGWAPAQRASDTGWMAPYLALLLDDPYDAVRYIASRSLTTLPGFETFQFDFVAPLQTRAALRVQALQMWRDTRPRSARRVDAALLFNPDGTFNAPAVDRLMRERNTRRVVYRE